MAFIKNIPHETVLPLAAEVAVQPGQVVSKLSLIHISEPTRH